MFKSINAFLVKVFKLAPKTIEPEPNIEFGSRDLKGFRQVYRNGKPVAKLYSFTKEMIDELRASIDHKQEQ